jgi:hypothetical protein
MSAHDARHRGSAHQGTEPRPADARHAGAVRHLPVGPHAENGRHAGSARHAGSSRHDDLSHLPPPPLADPAELVGIPAGRTAYRLDTSPGGRHRGEARFGRSVAVVGGVAGMAVTAVTFKVGAAAAVSSLSLSIQHLVR